MMLSENFELSEFTSSQIAERNNIDNTPDEDIIDNLKFLAQQLEKVRKILGAPMIITSGYRCLELNNKLGSKPTSAHVKGLAADFRSSFGNPSEIVKLLMNSDIQYDQVIEEFCYPEKPGSGWVHIAFTKDVNNTRRQALRINKHGVFTL